MEILNEIFKRNVIKAYADIYATSSRSLRLSPKR